MSVTNKPRIEAYIGASGSGKGVSITRRLAELKPGRLLIWDPRDEYDKAAQRFTTLSGLVTAFKRAGAGKIKARFVPGSGIDLAAAFGLVCDLAFTAGDVVLLAEELSDVTTATHAPAAWRRCVTQGRHRALHIIGAAQRPALIDKTFLGNCTYLRCFTLRYDDDRRTMAKALDVPQAQIDALQTDDTARGVHIRFMERDFRAGVVQAGSIRLSH